MIFTKQMKDLSVPHKHFCFVPRMVKGNGVVHFVWLGFVNRALVSTMVGDFWQYTLPQ